MAKQHNQNLLIVAIVAVVAIVALMVFSGRMGGQSTGQAAVIIPTESGPVVVDGCVSSGGSESCYRGDHEAWYRIGSTGPFIPVR